MNAKSIFAASLLVAGAAFAGTTEVTNDLVIGVLPIPLAAEQKEAILSIPWIEAGTNTSAEAGIAATNLIKTAGLSVDDTLTWYNTNDSETPYQQWKIVAGAGGTNYWGSAKKMLTLDSVSPAELGTSTIMKRGQALILTRVGEPASLPATNVYIVGQYTSNSAGTTTFAKATTSAGKVQYTYTLAAPPQVDQIGSVPGYIELNSNTWTNVGRRDTLIIGSGEKAPVEFIRGKVKVNNADVYYWGTNTFVLIDDGPYGKMVFDPSALIPIGQGFWYKSTDTNDNVTVEWAH